MNPIGRILLSLLDDAGTGLGPPDLLCRDAVRRLPVDGCGISLTDSYGVVVSTSASDDWCRSLVDLEATLGEGPSRDAFTSGRLVVVTDLEHQGAYRWPAYAAEAAALGARAVFSHPLRIGGIRLGTLDLYATRTGMLSDEDLASALRYVDAAVVILLHYEASQAAGTGSYDVEAISAFDLEFRTQPQIHQATGMISVQAGTGLATALQLMRARAYADGRPVADIARDVVERRITFT